MQLRPVLGKPPLRADRASLILPIGPPARFAPAGTTSLDGADTEAGGAMAWRSVRHTCCGNDTLHGGDSHLCDQQSTRLSSLMPSFRIHEFRYAYRRSVAQTAPPTRMSVCSLELELSGQTVFDCFLVDCKSATDTAIQTIHL